MGQEKRSLTDVGGINERRATVLETAGYESIRDLQGASEETLAEVDGIRDALAARIKSDVGDLPGCDLPTALDQLAEEGGITEGVLCALADAGFTSLSLLEGATTTELTSVDGIGESTARRVLRTVEAWADSRTDANKGDLYVGRVSGVDTQIAAALESAGYESVADLQGATPATLAEVPYVDRALGGRIAVEAGSLPTVGAHPSPEIAALATADGVTPGAVAALSRAGYDTAADVRDAPVARLTAIDGIGVPVAERLRAAAAQITPTDHQR